MRNETKKIISFAAGVVLGVSSLTCTMAADEPLHNNVAGIQNEEVTNDAISIKADGLKECYDAGSVIVFDATVTNNSDKGLEISAGTSGFGKAGTTYASITSEKGEVLKDTRWDTAHDDAMYYGTLEKNETVSKNYIYDLDDAEPGNYKVKITFTYKEDVSKTVSREFPFEVVNVENRVTKSYKDSAGNDYTLSMDSSETVVYSVSSESVSLEAVKIPEGVTAIKADADSVNKVKYFVLPESLAYIPANMGESWRGINLLAAAERENYIVSDLGMQYTSKINEDEIRVVYEKKAECGEYLKGYGKNVLVIAGDTYDKDQAKVALLMAQGKIKEQLDLRVYNKENKASVLFDENGNGKVDMEDARTVYEKAKGRAVNDKEWQDYCAGKYIVDYSYEYPLLYGDFDLDGKVTLTDAKKGLRLSLGIDEATEDESYVGNINGKGITLNEAKSFLRMSLGIENSREIV